MIAAQFASSKRRESSEDESKLNARGPVLLVAKAVQPRQYLRYSALLGHRGGSER